MGTVDFNLVLGHPGTHASGVLSAEELLAEMDRCDVERGFVSHLAVVISETASEVWYTVPGIPSEFCLAAG